MGTRALSLERIRRGVDSLALALAKELARSEARTRDIAVLDALRGEAARLERAILSLPPTDASHELRRRLEKHRDVVDAERASVLAAHSAAPASPAEIHLSEPGARANIYMSLARLHFAPGVKRVDVALLSEIIAGLESTESDQANSMPAAPPRWLVDNLAVIRAALQGSRHQMTAFRQLWSSGSAEERASEIRAFVTDQLAIAAAEEQRVPTRVRRPERLRAISETLRHFAGLLAEDCVDLARRALEMAEALEADFRSLEHAREAVDFGSVLEAEEARLDALHRALMHRKAEHAGLEDLVSLATDAASLALQAAALSRITGAQDELRARCRRRAVRFVQEAEARRALPAR